MAHLHAKPLAGLLLAACLAGCAGTGIDAIPAAAPGTSLADRFTKLLDDRCPIPAAASPAAASPADAQQTRAVRLLRAEWLLAILTRYGNARIEDFSGDKQADAAMLLTRVNNAIEIVKRARVDVARDPNEFELYRADLIVALLGTASSAIEPSLKTVSGFVVKPDPEDSLKLLGNYFKDRLYAQAYELTCIDFMAAAVNPEKRPAVARLVEEHLQGQCDKLARQSGLTGKCESLGGT